MNAQLLPCPVAPAEEEPLAPGMVATFSVEPLVDVDVWRLVMPEIVGRAVVVTVYVDSAPACEPTPGEQFTSTTNATLAPFHCPAHGCITVAAANVSEQEVTFMSAFHCTRMLDS